MAYNMIVRSKFVASIGGGGGGGGCARIPFLYNYLQ